MTKVSTKFGPYLRLNEDLVWSVLMLVTSVAFEAMAASLLQGLFCSTMIWHIPVRAICFVPAEFAGMIRATHSVDNLITHVFR